MKIKSAEYVGSFVHMKDLPPENFPEIAIVGRSNVGKSSLINKVLNRKKLAKKSSTPGKTRTINYYFINQSWYLVDLPGYGYARVSKAEKARWGKMIETYLREREILKGVLHLYDIRHKPSTDDLKMKQWLEHFQIPFLNVATKADKISRGAKPRHLKEISQTLNLPHHLIILFSAQSGEGVDQVLAEIQELLAPDMES